MGETAALAVRLLTLFVPFAKAEISPKSPVRTLTTVSFSLISRDLIISPSVCVCTCRFTSADCIYLGIAKIILDLAAQLKFVPRILNIAFVRASHLFINAPSAPPCSVKIFFSPRGDL